MPTAQPTTEPPLEGLTPLFDAAAMRGADAAASDEFAMPQLLLMERAGLGTAQTILARYPEIGRATVLVGKGNNGGDGLVIARHLHDAGWHVEVVLGAGEAPSTGDGAVMSEIAIRLGIPIAALDPEAGPPEGLIVDALLGTGAGGAPHGPVADAIRWVEHAPGPTVSCDVPSGVEADSGRVPGESVTADVTATYHGDMPGLHVAPGRLRAGEVEVLDIGTPAAVRSEVSAWLAGPGAAAAIPSKGAGADKYASGATLVVAGSEGLSGAACLSAEATLRAGGGLTVAVVPEAIQAVCARTVPEVMFSPSPGTFLGMEAIPEIERQAERVSAVAVGPGIGRDADTAALIWALCDRLALPLVLDADALFHLATDAGRLSGRVAPTVLTPHSGEASRLLGVPREEIEAGRLDAARRLAESTGACVVLKGVGTIIAAPGVAPIVNGVDAPALASAGTGDVLTGVITALLAKGLDARAAATAGVALHGFAGTRLTGDGATAGDLLRELPRALEAA